MVATYLRFIFCIVTEQEEVTLLRASTLPVQVHDHQNEHTSLVSLSNNIEGEGVELFHSKSLSRVCGWYASVAVNYYVVPQF